MTVRWPLYARAALLLALNLAVLVVVLIGWAGWGSLLSPDARERVAGIGKQIRNELAQNPATQWDSVLSTYGAHHGVQFSTEDPRPHGGGRRPPPESGTPLDRWPPRPGPAQPPPLPGADMQERIQLRHDGALGPYRIVIPGMIDGAEGPRPIDLIVTASSLWSLARFLGVGEWLQMALIALALSALIWAPFVIGMARSIVRLRQTTDG